MATFTGTATAFNTSNRVLHDESVQLLSGQIRCHLYTQPNAPVIANEVLADTTPMLGGGYPGPSLVTGNAITLVSGKNWRFTGNPVVFTAGAGGIVDAYWYAFYDDSSVSDFLIAFGQLDNTNNPVSAAQGDTITINPHPTDGFYLFATSS